MYSLVFICLFMIMFGLVLMMSIQNKVQSSNYMSLQDNVRSSIYMSLQDNVRSSVYMSIQDKVRSSVYMSIQDNFRSSGNKSIYDIIRSSVFKSIYPMDIITTRLVISDCIVIFSVQRFYLSSHRSDKTMRHIPGYSGQILN